MVSKSIGKYCKKVGILIDYQGSDVQFLAPQGMTFSTEASSRLIENYDTVPIRELRGHLDLINMRLSNTGKN